MALTQRLEFRQSQSLVMTPQLMQAIKLLQLSNLDLSAFVEEELERNPLLDRASDGPEAPVAGEPVPERAEFSDSSESSSYGDESGGEAFDARKADALDHHRFTVEYDDARGLERGADLVLLIAVMVVVAEHHEHGNVQRAEFLGDNFSFRDQSMVRKIAADQQHVGGVGHPGEQ